MRGDVARADCQVCTRAGIEPRQRQAAKSQTRGRAAKRMGSHVEPGDAAHQHADSEIEAPQPVRVDSGALRLEARAHVGMDRRAEGKKPVDHDGVSRNAEGEERH
jgi:hypothetical protein